MPPRTIPVRNKAVPQYEEKPKAPSSDSEGYGDDFEPEEEVKKELTAKPQLKFTKKAPSKPVVEDEEEEAPPPAPVKRNAGKDIFKKKDHPQESSVRSPPVARKKFEEVEPERERERDEEGDEDLGDERPIRPMKQEPARVYAQENRTEYTYIDDETKQLQQERVSYLKEYLGLEFERFDNLLEILPSSEYELYVNRIQNGVLANSGDQTNDERTNRETQTEDEFQNDFGNQWPEDKNRNVISNVANREAYLREEPRDDTEVEDTNKLIDFIKNAYPVIDEILTYQSKNITSKDKMMNIAPVEEALTIPEELFQVFDEITLLTAFESSKAQIFVSYRAVFTLNNKKYPLGLVIEYLNTTASRYFIAFSEIISLYVSINFRHALLGGTKEGTVLLWDLRDSNLVHSKNIHELVAKIKEKEGELYGDKFVYRFANYSTDFLGEQGHHSPVIRIKDIYSTKNVYEVFSLDEFGKVINWNIAMLNKSDASQTFSDPGMNFDSKIKLVKIADFDITEYYSTIIGSDETLLCSDLDIDKQGTNLFISNQKGVAKIETVGQVKAPKTYDNCDTTQGPTCVAVSALEYIYVGNRDGTIGILSKNYSKPIAVIGPFSKKPLVHIVLPKYYPITLRNPSKYLEQLTKPIAFDRDGNIYFFSLDQGFQPSHVENPIKDKARNQPFKLLHVWFESNLDMHLLYSVNNKELLHLNVNCSKVLDVTHEPIMQKQKKIPLLFKVT